MWLLPLVIGISSPLVHLLVKSNKGRGDKQQKMIAFAEDLFLAGCPYILESYVDCPPFVRMLGWEMSTDLAPGDIR